MEHRNALLQWYYSIYPLFGYCCVGTELFFILLFVLAHYPNELLSNVSHSYLICNGFTFSLIHLCPCLMPYDLQICFYGCLPACILKQLVNVVQLASAGEAIAKIDAEDAKSA